MAALRALETAAFAKLGYTREEIKKLISARAKAEKISFEAAEVEVMAEIDAAIATEWSSDDAEKTLSTVKAAGKGGMYGYLKQAKCEQLYGKDANRKLKNGATSRVVMARPFFCEGFEEWKHDLEGREDAGIDWETLKEIVTRIGGKNTQKIQKTIMAVITQEIDMKPAAKSVGLSNSQFSKYCAAIGEALLGRRRQIQKKIHTNRGANRNKQLGLDLAA
jgi:hypothetical protein